MVNEVLKFEDGALKLDVTVSQDRETVWLSANQMAKLYGRDYKTIRKHINNALKEELSDQVVVAKFATTSKHGAIDGKTQIHDVEYYNLDMILSVGYRVKSQNGIKFRKWATSILKDYMIKGIAVNEKRIESLNKTVQIQSKMLAHSLDIEQRDIMHVIREYENALSLLDGYDHQTLSKPEGSLSAAPLSYAECRKLIDNMEYADRSEVFGVEKEKGKFEGILLSVFQTAFGEEIYPSLEEKAANLLYFLVKDHPFADGCKRIATAVFLQFLHKNNFLYKENQKRINDSSLVAITLMIAESLPTEKEVMITLIMNLLI